MEKEMKIIYKGRGEGKTKDLIKMADDFNGYIVCRSQMVYPIADMAREMGCRIHFPLSYGEFMSGRYYPQGVRKVLIDDVDALIQSFSQVPVIAITLRKEVREGGK